MRNPHTNFHIHFDVSWEVEIKMEAENRNEGCKQKMENQNGHGNWKAWNERLDENGKGKHKIETVPKQKRGMKTENENARSSCKMENWYKYGNQNKRWCLPRVSHNSYVKCKKTHTCLSANVQKLIKGLRRNTNLKLIRRFLFYIYLYKKPISAVRWRVAVALVASVLIGYFLRSLSECHYEDILLLD